MGIGIPSVALALEHRANRKMRKAKRRGEPFPMESVRSGGGAKSKRKGASFEKTVAALFSAYLGCSVRRTPGSGGWATVGSFGPRGDLVFALQKVPFVVECKKHEGWDLTDLLTRVRGKDTTSTNSIERWWQQCLRDCSPKKIPMLVFARNRVAAKNVTVGTPPLLMMRLGDFHKVTTYKKDGVVVWDGDFIPRFTFTDDDGQRVVMLLSDYFKFVRPPKASPRRKGEWKRGIG